MTIPHIVYSFESEISIIRSSTIELPGIFRSSLAHSPKSINLHRSEQNGLLAFSGVHVFCLPQLGQLIFCNLFITIFPVQFSIVTRPSLPLQ